MPVVWLIRKRLLLSILHVIGVKNYEFFSNYYGKPQDQALDTTWERLWRTILSQLSLLSLISNPVTYVAKKRHNPSYCKFKDVTCQACDKLDNCSCIYKNEREVSQRRPSGHRDMKCKRDTKCLQTEEADDAELSMFITSQSSPSVLIELQLNGKTLAMELDTGGEMSFISQSPHDKLFLNAELHCSNIVLWTCTFEVITVTGQFYANVK